MKLAALAGALLLLGPATAVAKDWKLTLLPTADQEITYEDGRQVVRSKKPPKSGAALVLATERWAPKQSPTFVLTVKNYTDQPVNFTLANVRVALDVGETSVLSVSDIEAQARAVEKKARQAAMWQAIAVGLQAGAAGMQQTSTYNSHSYTPYGPVSTFGSITTPGNQAASSAILANGSAQIRATQDQGRAAANEILSSADDRGFRPATVEPDGLTTTALTLTRIPPKATSLHVEIILSGETHVFAFQLDQVK